MKEIAELLTGIASILWFGLVAYIVYRFSPGIERILGGIRKGKFFGQEFELLDKLNEEVAASAEKLAEAKALPEAQVSGELGIISGHFEMMNDVRKYLDRAQESPTLALIEVGIGIEEELREIVFSETNEFKGRPFTWSSSIQALVRKGKIPVQTAEALNTFKAVRNRLVHRGNDIAESEVIRAIDSGISLLIMLIQIPRGTYFVEESNIPVYYDSECENLIEDISGVMIRHGSITDERSHIGIYPTKSADYRVSEQVSWEWNMENVYGPAYFVHPRTGIKSLAWPDSAEFIGRHLNEI